MLRTTATLLGSAAVLALTAVDATPYSNEVATREIVTEDDSTADHGRAPVRVRTTVRLSHPGAKGSAGDPGTLNHGLRVRSA
ncbi:Hypothetical protein A7982_04432 [Minicystis rosea]|nr:Hypothetical protein A7982_04432 [Minicystis rosea]